MSCLSDFNTMQAMAYCIFNKAFFYEPIIIALAIIVVYGAIMWKTGMPKTVGLMGGLILLLAFRDMSPELRLFSDIGLMVGGALFALSIIYVSRN